MFLSKNWGGIGRHGGKLVGVERSDILNIDFDVFLLALFDLASVCELSHRDRNAYHKERAYNPIFLFEGTRWQCWSGIGSNCR